MEESGARTVGELLAGPRVQDAKLAHRHSVRARLNGSGATAFYEFYPTREMIVDEFDALWNKQKEFHGLALKDDTCVLLRRLIDEQRPLKPQPVGRCTLNPNEERAPHALPSGATTTHLPGSEPPEDSRSRKGIPRSHNRRAKQACRKAPCRWYCQF